VVRRIALLLVGLALFAVAGCGGSGDDGGEKTFDVEAGCRKALDSLQTKWRNQKGRAAPVPSSLLLLAAPARPSGAQRRPVV